MLPTGKTYEGERHRLKTELKRNQRAIEENMRVAIELEERNRSIENELLMLPDK